MAIPIELSLQVSGRLHLRSNPSVDTFLTIYFLALLYARPQDPVSAVQTRNAAATAPGLRAQARPPGTEFLDAETGRQKSSTNARTPTETKIQELSTRKSAQKRPIWRRVGNAWFARTGWWCVQSDTNRSPRQNCNNREKYREKREYIRKLAVKISEAQHPWIKIAQVAHDLRNYYSNNR